MRACRRIAAAAVLVGVGMTPQWAFANHTDDVLANAQTALGHHRSVTLPGVQRLVRQGSSVQRSATQRLADGDLLRRAKNFSQAASVFSQIIYRYPPRSVVYAEALFLLGETYYESHQWLSAKRVFMRVVQESSFPRVAVFRSKALARLTDIALKTNDLEAIDALSGHMGDGTQDPLLAYARTRLFLAKGNLDGALASQRAIPTTNPWYHQGKYLAGVVALRKAQAAIDALPEDERNRLQTRRSAMASYYAATVAAFREVTGLAQDTEPHKHVVELGWLALGRLFYETGQWKNAVDAYSKIPRQSAEFPTALFELASVYVEMADVHRAQRALEMLAVVDPQGAQAAEASLLRGELELRAGLFAAAQATFEGVKAQFQPMRERVDAFLNSTSDPAVYYDKLVMDQLTGIDSSDTLPTLAIQWARQAPDGAEAFAVVDEVVQTRSVLQQTERLVNRIQAIMESSGRSRAFPQLQSAEQTTISAINDLMRMRASLAKALTQEMGSNVSVSMAQVHKLRRSRETAVMNLPVTPAEFLARESNTSGQWNRAGQNVQQLQIQLDTLQSLVNALNLVLRNGASRGIVHDEAGSARLRAELQQHQHELEGYAKRIGELRERIDEGRIAAALATPDTVGDDNVRKQYKQVLEQEFGLALRGGAGANAQAFAKRAEPLLRAADGLEQSLEAALKDIHQRIENGSRKLLQDLDVERSTVAQYTMQLDALDQSARTLVGDVALRNFGIVRDRLKSIVVRADVGLTEQAWASREVQQMRVRTLQSERARAERLLQEELREVLDDETEP